MSDDTNQLQTATFGSGCFWCTEAIFQQIEGVISVESGYTGGKVKTPTYREICSGQTGHAEVVRIAFDPDVVSYDDLLEIFWSTHDPTTLNRQGADVGTQYRSAVFFHDEEQRQKAEKKKEQLTREGRFEHEIVTEISAAPEFYPAEDYHQNYFSQNSNAPYCSFVIQPKLNKFKKNFAMRVKG